MKFDCGPTRTEKRKLKEEKIKKKYAHLSKWHKRFAWFPVKVGSHDCRWLETIEKRIDIIHDGFGNFYFREYRPIDKDK